MYKPSILLDYLSGNPSFYASSLAASIRPCMIIRMPLHLSSYNRARICCHRGSRYDHDTSSTYSSHQWPLEVWICNEHPQRSCKAPLVRSSFSYEPARYTAPDTPVPDTATARSRHVCHLARPRSGIEPAYLQTDHPCRRTYGSLMVLTKTPT